MRRLFMSVIAAVMLTGCSATASAPTASSAAAPTASATALSPVSPILTLPFTEAHSGQSLTLASFAGKTVVVEGMAVWCTNCLAQQKQVAIARQNFGENVQFISLDIDASEDAAKLTSYAQDKGFGWTFTLANKPLMDALVAQFGRTITNPSNMPMFIVSPNGTLSSLLSNGHSADDLTKLIKQPPTA